MNNGFFAMANRMKYINRWQLMRSEHSENLAEHSFEVAIIAHVLVTLANKRSEKNLNADRAAFLGLYHDMPETITGDMPTPVKYGNDELKSIYDKVEKNACEKLINMLPEDLRDVYSPALEINEQDKDLKIYIKAADKISALIKCIEEKKAGNTEFVKASQELTKVIRQLKLPEADIFLDDFLPSYSLSLDELK